MKLLGRCRLFRADDRIDWPAGSSLNSVSDGVSDDRSDQADSCFGRNPVKGHEHGETDHRYERDQGFRWISDRHRFSSVGAVLENPSE